LSQDRKPGFSGRLRLKRVAKKRGNAHRNQSDKKLLDPIEEKRDDPEKSDHDEADIECSAREEQKSQKSAKKPS